MEEKDEFIKQIIPSLMSAGFAPHLTNEGLYLSNSIRYVLTFQYFYIYGGRKILLSLS
jgi:hypothetical protein